MGWSLRKAIGLNEQRSNPERISSSATASDMMAFFGLDAKGLPDATDANAMKVPAYAAARAFLSGSLANLPLHAFSGSGDNTKRAGGALQRILNEAPNAEWSSYAARKYFWSGVFGERGRGLLYIERGASGPIALWPMDPTKTTVKRVGVRKIYEWQDGNTKKTYDAADVIDVPFLLMADQLSSYSSLSLGEKAIQLSLSMNDYASNLFAGGGVPPLAVEGPLPAGKEALSRAMKDIRRAIDQARESGSAVFPMPPGHTLKAVGFEPDKGQLIEARRFQVEEIARVFSLPPVFLQDLTHGTFSNTEQQDLHLVKHTIAQWAKALEDEMNLKLFPNSNRRFVEHSLDGLMRGDLKSRVEALARGINSALITPDEARALDNRPADPSGAGAKLYIQGATVPLESSGQQQDTGTPPPADGGNNDDGA